MLADEEERMQNAGFKVGGLKNAWVRFVLEYPEFAQCRVYFRAGKFGLMNNENINANTKEILIFTEEFFEKGILEIKTGIESGIFRSDIDPVIVVALYIMIHDNIFAIIPDLMEALSTRGIIAQQLFRKISDFLDFMILNTEKELKHQSN